MKPSVIPPFANPPFSTSRYKLPPRVTSDYKRLSRLNAQPSEGHFRGTGLWPLRSRKPPKGGKGKLPREVGGTPRKSLKISNRMKRCRGSAWESGSESFVGRTVRLLPAEAAVNAPRSSYIESSCRVAIGARFGNCKIAELYNTVAHDNVCNRHRTYLAVSCVIITLRASVGICGG